MLKSQAVAYFGTVSAVAEALGITVAAVSSWDDIIPEGSAYKLQVVTDGALRVRPELYKDRPKRGQTLHDVA